MNSVLPLAGIAAASALLVPVAAGAQTAVKKPVPAKPAGSGVQKATVVIDGGYSPSSLSFAAGRPVEITFVSTLR